ncbi:unnamed protein product [Rotaria sordida]|uniref:Uncharacterized protein n=1 Tax=Rotaria sordida TaxID=392033 RepID=A0A813PW22_9BILA|nr:unnamed protein product [Rotaria sordida]
MGSRKSKIVSSITEFTAKQITEICRQTNLSDGEVRRRHTAFLEQYPDGLITREQLYENLNEIWPEGHIEKLVSYLFHIFNGVPRFANYIQDHMILQRAPRRAVIWGYGDASKLTILKMNNKSITLEPVYDEGPFDIHVSQQLANGTLVTITLHNVLFGDVWICSGQSNMQMTVSLIFNVTGQIANGSNYPKIRVFTAALKP